MIIKILLIFLLSATYAEAALKNDNFDDNSVETDFWAVLDSGDGASAETNNQYEVTGGGGGSGAQGLVTTNAHDLTYCDITVDVDNTNQDSTELFICLTKVTGSAPFSENDWYRIMKFNQSDDYYVQKNKAGGGAAVLATGSWSGASGSLRITIVGGTITFYEESTQRFTESYDLSSYNCYVYIFCDVSTSGTVDTFDNFQANSGSNLIIVH